MRRLSRGGRFFLFFIFLFLSSNLLQAAPGDLDSSFGTDGRVFTSIGEGAGANAVKIQTDGKILTAAQTCDIDFLNCNFALTRYDLSGNLDSGFGNNGTVLSDFQNGNDGPSDLALQSDGKIIVVGFASNGGDQDFALARYNSDGSLDSSFGNGGQVLTDFGSGDDSASAVGILSDGKLIVAGMAFNGVNFSIVLVRYNTNGSLDSSFANGGKLITSLSNESSTGVPFGLQSDGKMIVADDSGLDIPVLRYNSDGSLDSSFGTGGQASLAEGLLYVLNISQDGKIVFGGAKAGGEGEEFWLTRLNSDGSLDSGFGTNGEVLTSFGGDDRLLDFTFQSDGKIVAVGFSENQGERTTFPVARYNSDGSLDTSFGSGGLVNSTMGSSGVIAYAVAIQNIDIQNIGKSSEEMIVVAGSSEARIALARFLGNAAPGGCLLSPGEKSLPSQGFLYLLMLVLILSGKRVLRTNKRIGDNL